MESYAFTKKQSMKGNTEMRTMFGRNMAVVLTKVNDFYYINLYNNNPRNPGRCSLGWDEFLELTQMKDALEQLFPQFKGQQASQVSPPQLPQVQQQQQQQQQPTTSQELMPPPYTAQPIKVLGPSNKRPSTLPTNVPPLKKRKGEENFDPMDFFTQLM